MLDDISIPAIDYQSDFETDQSGWDSAGFVRVQNSLPQTYRLSLIVINQGKMTVEKVALDAAQSVKIPLDFDNGTTQYSLVVSGTTRFTRTEAPYSISIDQ